jgi:hypothetical protein
MKSVNAAEIGQRIIKALNVKDGDLIDFSKLRDGSVRLSLRRENHD